MTKAHKAPRCPRCEGVNISLDTVEWDAVSREDSGNRPILIEHECRDCSLSFWTGAGELVEPPMPPRVCPGCAESTEVNALAQVVCINEKCGEHVVWEVQ